VRRYILFPAGDSHFSKSVGLDLTATYKKQNTHKKMDPALQWLRGLQVTLRKNLLSHQLLVWFGFSFFGTEKT
jgi:hypothetical protein